ncbi:armadillo repeat-containing protein 5 isoform X1 [Athalia rosae]|uniref:armadillo repeat-containing protein 5 isoform X1 n=1 Tax=Athalia rosae TaxID=37344 RepID=UPI0020341FC8|nr:armadillo repeat-containing protein 5 isoform X1 [Athalia rosae]
MSSTGERSNASSHQLTLDLMKNLNSTSNFDICISLTILKQDTQCHKQFVKDGGISVLVGLLGSDNYKILDLLLSILANMCLESYVRQELYQARGLDLATKVTGILKTIKSPSIQCRACRLVGNLAECKWHARALYQSGIIKVITNLFKSCKIPVSVQLTAIRAIRNIWSVLESSRDEILENGTFREVTTIFVLAGEGKQEKCREVLIDVCLKAMCAFLQTSDPRCSEQLRGKTDMEGFKSIVQQCKAKNRMAIKCLYILSQIAECRPVLGTLGAIEFIVSAIAADTPFLWELLASLCLFCREAVNRVRIRTAIGLEVMLGILKQEGQRRYHPMLLHALAQFIYDDQSILIMIKYGLLDVLITNLREMILEDPNDCIERCHPKKRGARSPLNKRIEVKFHRSDFGRFSLDYKRDDWSPGSATSMCSSPPSTPPLSSFFEDYIDEMDGSAEENYSPVCSDTECGENDEDLEDEAASIKSCSSFVMEFPVEGHDFGNTCKTTISKQARHMWTLTLLSRLSHSNEPVDKLADPATIQPLIAYIRVTKNGRASRILARIIRNRSYLVTLMKQGFVFELQTMRGSEQYIRQLSALAETGCALGELASILLRGQEADKIVIAVSIPFLIQSKDALRTLLKTHRGLSFLFRVLTDRTHDLHINAVYAVCRLANALEIDPQEVDRNPTQSTTRINISKTLDYHLKPTTVTFELDDGTTVDAHRTILCQRSEFFSAMLEGNFYESGRRRVKLKNTSKQGLDTLLLAVNGCPYSERPIESLLDAVILADKFLMSDVLDSLIEISLSNINLNNVSRTWHWAHKNACYELRTGCVKIFLTAKSTKPARLQAFNDFGESERFSEFIGDLEKVLRAGLLGR